jgi:hypothetical protein
MDAERFSDASPEEPVIGPDPQRMTDHLAYQQTPRQVISGSSVP